MLKIKNPPNNCQVLLTDWKVLVYSLGLVCSKWLVVVVAVQYYQVTADKFQPRSNSGEINIRLFYISNAKSFEQSVVRIIEN